VGSWLLENDPSCYDKTVIYFGVLEFEQNIARWFFGYMMSQMVFNMTGIVMGSTKLREGALFATRKVIALSITIFRSFCELRGSLHQDGNDGRGYCQLEHFLIR